MMGQDHVQFSFRSRGPSEDLAQNTGQWMRSVTRSIYENFKAGF
jgi:hypothetical protein